MPENSTPGWPRKWERLKNRNLQLWGWYNDWGQVRGEVIAHLSSSF
jgi:hypothetical protein